MIPESETNLENADDCSLSSQNLVYNSISHLRERELVKARGRPRRAWTDDLKDWTELRNYSELKRTAEDRTIWNALARQPST